MHVETAITMSLSMYESPRELKTLYYFLVVNIWIGWFIAADINQGGKQCSDGHGGSRHQRDVQRSRRSQESVPTCSVMHQGASGWPANHARSGPSARDSCPASWGQMFGPYTDGSAPVSMLRGRVCKPQDTPLHQLLIHEHLRCPTLPQIWRGYFWDQCLKLLLPHYVVN